MLKFFKNTKYGVIMLLSVAFIFSCATTSAPPTKAAPESAPPTKAAPESEKEKKGTVSIQETFNLDGHDRGVQGLSFNNQNQTLASGGWDNDIFIWDYIDGTRYAKITAAHDSDVISLAYDPAGTFLASSGLDKTIKFWGPDDGSLIKTFDGFKHNVIGIDVFHSGDTVLVAASVLTGEVVVFHYNTGKRIATFWHDSYATNVAFSPDGTMLASTGNDNLVRVWDLETNSLITAFSGHTAKVNTVDFSPDGKFLVSAGWDNTVIVWDLESGSQKLVLNDGHTDAIESVRFSSDGNYIVSGARDGLIVVWNVDTGEKITTYDTGVTRVYNVRFNESATKLAVAGYDHSVRVYDFIEE